MKKIVLFLLMILLISGCSMKEINQMSIDEVIDTITATDKNLYNRVGIGYKYYLPVGILVESSNEYNEILYANNNIYYLFIDAVSYYNKQQIEIQKSDQAFYYREFYHQNKKGYLQILESKDQYYIKVIYNYAKIESYISKSDLKEALYNIICVLSSIKYNEPVINDYIEKRSAQKGKEVTIEDFTPQKSGTTFLEYIEKYDDYDKSDDVNDIDIDTIVPNVIN